MKVTRAVTTAVATGAMVVLAAGPAAAHFCSNVQRVQRANEAIAKNSNGWLVVSRDLGLFFGDLCPEGLEHLVEAYESGGADADVPILAHSVLEAGVAKQMFAEDGEPRKTALPKPIKYNFEAFGALEEALEEAYVEDCGMEFPEDLQEE